MQKNIQFSRGGWYGFMIRSPIWACFDPKLIFNLLGHSSFVYFYDFMLTVRLKSWRDMMIMVETCVIWGPSDEVQK